MTSGSRTTRLQNGAVFFTRAAECNLSVMTINAPNRLQFQIFAMTHRRHALP